MRIKRTMLLTFTTLALATGHGFSQTINGVPLASLDAQYLEIRAYGKLLSSVVTIEIDYGQLDVALDKKDTELRDEKGRAMEFNSIMAAINFMDKQGYELMQVYVLTSNSGSSCYYLMRRKESRGVLDK